MDNPEHTYSICYWLDLSDVIVDIGPGWEQFARENNAQQLEPGKVIGRNLIDFVAGDVTKMYVRTILQSARLIRRPMVRAYRCDSPEQRRFMEMRLTMQDNGLLKWEHRLIRTEDMQRRMDFRPAAGLHAAKCTVRCSMCNRLKSASGWYEPDQVPLPRHLEDGGSIPVIYGVCPDCQAIPLRQISGRSI
jgi:hypothetical protein